MVRGSWRPHRVLLFWHYVGDKFLTILSNMLADLNLSDVWTCHKAFRREVLQKLTIQENRFGFEQEITCKVAANCWRSLRSDFVLRPHLSRRQEDHTSSPSKDCVTSGHNGTQPNAVSSLRSV